MYAALMLSIVIAQADMTVGSGTLEGRPPAARLSPIQALVDAAAPGATIEVAAGTYDGDLFIDRPLRLVGIGRPLLRGSGAGSVVLIRAADVTIEGFDVDGGGGGDLGRDSSGIHVAAPRARIGDTRVRNTLFGIYLREAHGSSIERSRVEGIRDKAAGEKGSGIHVWNTDGFELTDNEIVDVRDGVYIQSSPHGRIRGNVARDLRYGLHYMYSDDNVFEDNVFENGDAGTAVMYSRRLTFRRNQFLRNRGFASVGLLLKTCDDVIAEDNVIADNARGVFIEGSIGNVLRGNVIAGSDAAVVLFDSATGIVFSGNSFVGNLAPLALSGRRTDADFTGNYWSDNPSPDLDGDGRTDQPYRLSSLFDHLRGNLTAADLLSRSFAASAIGAAERAFPVLRPVPVVDRAPLARPPALRVPAVRTRERTAAPLAAAGSGTLIVLSAAVLLSGRRRSGIRGPGGRGPGAGGPGARGRGPGGRGGRGARGRGAGLIIFREVVKRFGANVAVDHLSVPVARGEVVALLGPNGSGKTTTLKIAAGLIAPDSGEVTIGEPPRPPRTPDARRAISFLPQRVAFPEALTGVEVVEFYRALRGAPASRTHAVLRVAALNGAGDRPVSTYSGGMLQRLGLAVAMLPEADVLLLDEPTAALDPEGLCAFYGLVERRRREGGTVFFTSHQVGDVERLADRFLVLVRGRLVAELTQAALRERLSARGVMRVRLSRPPATLLDDVRRIAPDAVWVAGELIVPGAAALRPIVLDLARRSGAEVLGLVAQDGQLDALYRELVATAPAEEDVWQP